MLYAAIHLTAEKDSAMKNLRGFATFSRKDTVIQDTVYVERNIKCFHRA